MKRIICAIWAVTLFSALTACGGADVANSYPPSVQQTMPAQETTPTQEPVPTQEIVPPQETAPATEPTAEMPTQDPVVPSEIVIPNPKLSSISTTKMSDGLMMIAEGEIGRGDRRYGFMNYKGEIVVPVQYTYAEDFSNGCAIVTSPGTGTGVINTRGEVIVPLKYNSVINNGNYLIASTRQDCDLYKLSGEYCGHLPASAYSFADGPKLSYAYNCPLFAIPDGRKFALATETGVITEAVYDSINLIGGSNFAVLRVGEMSALAGPNGIIFNLSATRSYARYASAVGNYVLVCEYDYSVNVNKYAIADINGNVSDFVTGRNDSFGRLVVKNGIAVAYGDFDCFYYDITTGQTYYTDGYHRFSDWFSHYEFPDGRCLLGDGTWCLGVEGQDVTNYRGDYSRSPGFGIYQALDGKYGLCFRGTPYTDAVYNSAEEVWENYGYYKIEQIAGKPAVVYGNESKGFAPVIQFGKNNLPYDEIIDLGEDYYACRFNETWYLVHP